MDAAVPDRRRGSPSSDALDPFAGTPTHVLVDRLAKSGLAVPEGLPQALRRRPDATEGLLGLVRQRKYWSGNGPGGGWAPIHALHLLAARRDPEGFEALLEVLRRHPDDLGDWLTEVVPSWFAAYGPEIAPRLEGIVRDESLNSFVRLAAADALAAFAGRDAELGRHVKELLLSTAADTSDEDVSGCLAITLAEFVDPSLRAELRVLFAAGKVSRDFITWSEVEALYAGESFPLEPHIKDPMDHFRPEELRRLRAIQDEWRRGPPPAESRRPMGSAEVRKDSGGRKPGRNDPCPCGSGKKFKKCHGKP